MIFIVFSILVVFFLCINTIKFRGLLVLVGVLYISLSGLYVISDMFTGAGFNASVMYHLYTGVQGAGFSEYVKEIAYAVGFIFCVIALFLTNTPRVRKKGGLIRISQFISLPIMLSLFAISPWGNNYYDQGKLYISGVFDKRNVSDEYVVNKSMITNKKI